jgi:acid phosphatase type 7
MAAKQVVLCILFTIFAATTSFAESLEITHGPYLQHVTTEAAIISWSTSVECVSWVEFYKQDGSNFYQQERQKVYGSLDGLKTIARLHKVTLKNLKPATTYSYRIYSREINDGVWGKTVATRVYKNEPLHFSTLDRNKKETSCIVLSDMHTNAAKTGSLLQGVKWEEMDFVIFNGDFMSSFNDEKDLYNGVIDTSVALFAQEKPLYIVRGNHETRGKKARELDDYFSFPNNKYYYTFSSGSTCFIVLDSGEDKPDSDIEYNDLADFDSYREEQAKWLANVADSEQVQNAERVVVFMHIPPYTNRKCGEWHGTLHVRKLFVPILNKAGIDLMVCGHTHSYSFVPRNEAENNFPIIISDNTSRLELHIDESGIKAIRVDAASNILSGVAIDKKGEGK